MERVEDWFGAFVVRHVSRCPREDWPEPMTEHSHDFFDGWRHGFVTKGVTERYAQLASLDLAAEPPRFLSDHLPALLKVATEHRLREDCGIGTETISGDIKDAEQASAQCPDCGGNGTAVRYVHASILGKLKTARGADAPIGSAVSFPCSCPLGQHISRGQAQDGKPAPPTIDRYPSLRRKPCLWGSDAPDGLDKRYRYRPDRWDDELGTPFSDPEATYDLDSLKAITLRLPRPPSAASKDRGRGNQLATLPPPQGEAIRPVPGRPDILGAASDPLVARELAGQPRNYTAKPAPTEELEARPLPEEIDDPSGWY